jgi:hypothetical protein
MKCQIGVTNSLPTAGFCLLLRALAQPGLGESLGKASLANTAFALSRLVLIAERSSLYLKKADDPAHPKPGFMKP